MSFDLPALVQSGQHLLHEYRVSFPEYVWDLFLTLLGAFFVYFFEVSDKLERLADKFPSYLGFLADLTRGRILEIAAVLAVLLIPFNAFNGVRVQRDSLKSKLKTEQEKGEASTAELKAQFQRDLENEKAKFEKKLEALRTADLNPTHKQTDLSSERKKELSKHSRAFGLRLVIASQSRSLASARPAPNSSARN